MSSTIVISGDGRTTCKQTKKRTPHPPLYHMVICLHFADSINNRMFAAVECRANRAVDSETVVTVAPCPWPPSLFRKVGTPLSSIERRFPMCDCMKVGKSSFVMHVSISVLAVSLVWYCHPFKSQTVFIVLSNAFRHSARHSLCLPYR